MLRIPHNVWRVITIFRFRRERNKIKMVGNSSKNNSQIETLLESVEQFISDEDKIVSLQ